ncbi:MAG: type II toxin-antitoxin system death-on-curing family toxin [Nanoarchaeota archaeon]
MIQLTKKDLIRINQEVGERGQFQNESSLDFALSQVKYKKSWLYELAYLLRSLLTDHIFEDGNKRTALALSILYFEEKELEWDGERLIKNIHLLAKHHHKSIEKISRVIKNALN